MQKLLYICAYYLFKKNIFERLVIIFIFALLGFVVLSSLENKEWSNLQRYSLDPLSTQNDIAQLIQQYNVKSKCLRIICTNDELPQNSKKQNTSHEKVQAVNKSQKINEARYTMLLTCKSLSCYEFIRSFENLPMISIYKIRAFNITLLEHHENTQEKGRQTGFLNTMQDLTGIMKKDSISPNSSQENKAPTLAWSQDMEVIFTIGKIGK